jgi:hypothetical protein
MEVGSRGKLYVLNTGEIPFKISYDLIMFIKNK